MTTALGGDTPDWVNRTISTDDILIPVAAWSLPGQSALIDVSQYASVIIAFSNTTNVRQIAIVSWFDPAGNLLTQDYMTQVDGQRMPNIALPVRAQNMQVSYSCQGALTVSIALYGSARQIPGAISQGYFSPVTASVASQALAASTQYLVAFAGPQGWVQYDFTIGGSTTVTGEWLCVYNDTNGNLVTQRILDTSEMHVVSINQVGHGQMILPHVPYSIKFLCRTSGTASLGCNLIALGS